MSIKYTDILKTIDADGIKVSSYYGKYLVNSYDEALQKARESGFMAGIRVDGVEKGELFNSREEFEILIKKVKYPCAIVPLL